MTFDLPVITQCHPRRRAAALRAAIRQGRAFVLLAPPEVRFSAQAQQQLAAAAAACPPDVAVLAARVLPNGPDWHCDPVTLEADRMDLKGVLLRCAALRAVGGFDTGLTGQAADADLCWRLRGAGWRLLYCPQIVAWETGGAMPKAGAGAADAAAPTASSPTGDTGEPAGLTAYVRDAAGLCVLRAKYRRPGLGLQAAYNTLRAPRHYPGVRRALLAAAPACLLRTLRAMLRPAPKAACALAVLEDGFGPRRGACPITAGTRQRVLAAAPTVSVVVRTCGRPDMLRHTLACLRHQTYPHFEVVVVEDGPPAAQAMLAAQFAGLPLRYHATGQKVGRGRAANLGLQLAQGSYVSFLDDDDFYYPDYIETHLAALLETGQGFVLSGTMALETRLISRSPYRFAVQNCYPVLFDHITLMDMCVKCRVPSCGGMLQRSLALAAGGMREDLEGDEDWALWLRCWQRSPRRQSPPEIPRALGVCCYPADPAAAAARTAAYEVYDAQLLADDSLRFACTAGEVALWQRTVAADVAHLRALGRLQPLLAEAARRPAAALDAGGGTFTAGQINRYYWYLVRQAGAL